MSDRQQARAADVKNTSSAKKHLPSKNIPPNHLPPSTIVQHAQLAPSLLTSTDVLQLQRTIGNQAVGQLLADINSSSLTNQQSSIQRQEIPEEEELLQGKRNETVQLQPELEDEELLQGKFADDCVQCQIPEEEEELLQGKMTNTLQRQVPEDEELMQGKFASGMNGVLQTKEGAKTNNTGMPDNLKTGIENLSGMAMNDVKVHYNSTKPAQVQALAYTQGTNIHVGPGQEKHLPHESWHVVQQMQGRVRPTMQYRGVAINDDEKLEKEADVMGAKSLETSNCLPVELAQKKSNKNTVAQLELDGDGYSTEQQELLDLLDVLQKNKSKITSVSESELEEAIRGIMQIVQSGDESTISDALKKIKNVAENAHPGESESGTVQLAPWSKKGAAIGALIGTLIPVIGNIVGGIIGYKLGKKRDKINRLCANGATRAEVTAMLAIEPDAQIIHNYMTIVIPGFTVGNILYSTVSGGNVGSIYFNGSRRVRLTHPNSPAVEFQPGANRYTISRQDDNLVDMEDRAGRLNFDNNPVNNVAIYNFVSQLASFQPAVADQGDVLVEFWGANGIAGNHFSRGGPVAFNYVLTQTQLNILCNVANLHNNDTLRAWMAAIPALAAIPINP